MENMSFQKHVLGISSKDTPVASCNKDMTWNSKDYSKELHFFVKANACKLVTIYTPLKEL